MQTAGKATSLSLIGAVATTVANFGIAILVTRASTAFAGIFFTATALVSILANGSCLGSMTGLIYFTPKGLDENGKPVNVRPILRIALQPVILLSTALGLIVAFQAPRISGWVGVEQVTEHTQLLRYSAIAIPAWAILLVLLGATRTLGTMTPHVVINQIFRPLTQIALLTVVFVASDTAIPDPRLVALAWASPIVVSTVLAFVSTVRLGGLTHNGDASVSNKEFWRYNRPRSASVLLQSLLERVDVIIISRLAGEDIAGIYGSISRYITAGNYLIFSIGQATAPALRRAIANKRTDIAQALLQKVTAWMVLVTWPYFLLLAFKSEGATRLLDSALVDGKTTLSLLALGMTASAFAGPIDLALLMLGRSRRSLFSTALAVIIDVGLAIILIPEYGLVGAGIAWIIAVVVQNGLNSFFVYSKSGHYAISRGSILAALGAAICFGVPAYFTSQSFGQMVLAGSIGAVAYLGWVLIFAKDLHIKEPLEKVLAKAGLAKG